MNSTVESLVESHMGLVYHIAGKYHSVGLEFMDRVQEGSLGLVIAANRFDPDLNFEFSTYAAWWIKQSIKRALLTNVRPVHIPTYMVALINQWRRTAAELEIRLGRAPDIEEMADIMQLPLRKSKIIHQLVSILGSVRDITGGDGSDEEQMLEATLCDRNAGKGIASRPGSPRDDGRSCRLPR